MDSTMPPVQLSKPSNSITAKLWPGGIPGSFQHLLNNAQQHQQQQQQQTQTLQPQMNITNNHNHQYHHTINSNNTQQQQMTPAALVQTTQTTNHTYNYQNNMNGQRQQQKQQLETQTNHLQHQQQLLQQLQSSNQYQNPAALPQQLQTVVPVNQFNTNTMQSQEVIVNHQYSCNNNVQQSLHHQQQQQQPQPQVLSANNYYPNININSSVVLQQQQQQQQDEEIKQQQQLQLQNMFQMKQFPNVSQVNQLWVDALAKAATTATQTQQPATMTIQTAVNIDNNNHNHHQSSSLSSSIEQLSKTSFISSSSIKQSSTSSSSGNKTNEDPPSSLTEAELKRRNREYAKRARERRKNEHQLLEEELVQLQKENNRLRNIVRNNIPDHAQQIISDCCINHPLHQAVSKTLPSNNEAKEPATQTQNNKKKNNKKYLMNSDFGLIENLIKGKQSFVITDPMQPDNPIVYASEAFFALTGYNKEQTIGRNCRFLQGQDTDLNSVAMIRQNIDNGKDISVNLLNYKADGTPFWNQFFIAALRDRDNQIVNYVGVQCEIEDPNAVVVKKENENGQSSSTNNEQQSSSIVRIKRGHTAVTHISPSSDNNDTATAKKNSNNEQQQQQQQNDPLMDMPVQPLEDKIRVVQQHPIRSKMTFESSNNKEEHESKCKNNNRIVDWSTLADVLEADFRDGMINDDDNDNDFDWDLTTATSKGTASNNEDNLSLLEDNADDNDNNFANEEEQQQPQQKEEEEKDNVFEIENNINSIISYYTNISPRDMITRTIRSEVVESLLSAHGDVTNERFLKVLDVISSIYNASSSMNTKPINNDNDNNNEIINNFLNGEWISLSKPAYKECLGKNNHGDYMYTLGKMSFDMFKPINLICSVQHTLNNIHYVCEMDKTTGPKIAIPWSLRRELALLQPPKNHHTNKEEVSSALSSASSPKNTTLRSYDIIISVTIGSPKSKSSLSEVEGSSSTALLGRISGGDDDDHHELPSFPLKAVQSVQGYILLDPEVKNRLTVWFTGGKLKPALQQQQQQKQQAGQAEVNSSCSIKEANRKLLQEWKRTFGAAQKKKITWTESLKNMGAKLLLGADLPDEMQADGTMSYSLHRPYGGHGKSYVDILYLDEELYITRGNYGTIHVAVRSSLLSSESKTTTASSTPTLASAKPEHKNQATKEGKRELLDKSIRNKKNDTTTHKIQNSKRTPSIRYEKSTKFNHDKREIHSTTNAITSGVPDHCKSSLSSSSSNSAQGTKKRKANNENMMTVDCESVDSNNTDEATTNTTDSPSCYYRWKVELLKELEKNGAERIANELNDILIPHGLKVSCTTKKMKH